MEELKCDNSGSLQCLHPSFIKNKCTKCNKHKKECGNPTTLPFYYLEPNLTLTFQEINHRRDKNLQSLISRKKLQLVLDLDHTLVHALSMYDGLTFKEIERSLSMDDAHQILFGRYLLKLRPGAREFLKELSSMFDLSVFTMAHKEYAREVVSLLDYSEDGPSCFSWVIANEDCAKNDKKGLDLVLAPETVVLIVDDIENVWEDSGAQNLIKIRPYEFFPEEEEAKGMDMELSRVLSILRAVHTVFYEDGEVDYCTKDVREVLKKVVSNRACTRLPSDRAWTLLPCFEGQLYCLSWVKEMFKM